MQLLCTSPSCRSPHGSKSNIVQKNCCPSRKGPGKQWQRGTGLSESACERHQTQEPNPLLLSQCHPAPLGRRSQWLQASHSRCSSQGRVYTSLCTSGQAPGFSPGAPLEHPPSVGLHLRHSWFQWGRAGGHAGIHPSRVQLPLPNSHAVLTPAPFPCGNSPDWDSNTAQLGQDRNPGQLVRPGGHSAAQMVIFKSQTLSSAVISVSPLTHPGADGHSSPTPATQPSSLP